MSNDRPRFVVRRHVNFTRAHRFSYTWNRWGYPLSDMDSGHLGHHARSLPGAWAGALMLPVRDLADRLKERLYRDAEWTL